MGRSWSRRQQIWMGYLFVAPVTILFAVFRLYPLVKAAYLSFFDWNPLSITPTFIGFGNFAELASDLVFRQSIVNTLLYTIGIVPGGLMLGLAAALLFNGQFHSKAFQETAKTACFMPVITPMVAAAAVWMWIYQPNFGLLNGILSALGLPRVQWLQSSRTALFSIIIFSLWKGMGYTMIIYLAGLQGIPDTYYEAALIDGANRWHCFRYITLPLLIPTTVFLLITSTIGAMQVFTQVQVMTGGGPANATIVIVLYVYRLAFEFMRSGYSTAAAMVLFLMILLVTLIQLKWGSSKVSSAGY